MKTKAEALAFIRKVMGPATRKIEGKEFNDTMLLLMLVGPYKETNNQRSSTEYYKMGGKEYRLHYFPEWESNDKPCIPEMEVIEDDI
jgi:hypothetical protein